MKQSGLFINGEKGYFDRFYSRLIFPISDINSNVIAFAGRSLDKSNQAKYINSIETPVYNKSKVFYGLDLVKKEIIEKKGIVKAIPVKKNSLNKKFLII